MLKFFYSTASGSTPSHIAIQESGIQYTPVEVSFKREVNVDELEKVNPLGRVPALLSAEGKSLSQNGAIMEYIADLAPESRLLAKHGTWERTETMQWVIFAASDFQKAFLTYFSADQVTDSEPAQKGIQKFAVELIREYLQYVDKSLEGKDFLMGKQFTIADCYIFALLGWTTWIELDTSEYRNIQAYMKRVYNRPAVQKVLKEEDLLDFVK
jgi:glutathione S-transferase